MMRKDKRKRKERLKERKKLNKIRIGKYRRRNIKRKRGIVEDIKDNGRKTDGEDNRKWRQQEIKGTGKIKKKGERRKRSDGGERG